LIRTVLRNDQWERIAPELRGKAGDPGVTARDNRLFVEAVLWIARTGAPWRDVAEEFGNWYTLTRFWRLARKGVWDTTISICGPMMARWFASICALRAM